MDCSRACQVDALPAVDGYQPQRVASHPSKIKRPANASMHGCRGVRGQLLGAGCDPTLPHIRAQTRIPRDQYREQVGHRRTGDEEPARCRGKTEEGAHPEGHLVFDLQRNLIAATHICVQPGGQHLCQHAHRSSAALYPAQKTGVGIARREGQNRAHKLCVDLREWPGLGGKWFSKMRPHLVRDRLPNGIFAHGFHVLEHVVEHAVGLRAKTSPVLRVE